MGLPPGNGRGRSPAAQKRAPNREPRGMSGRPDVTARIAWRARDQDLELATGEGEAALLMMSTGQSRGALGIRISSLRPVSVKPRF